MKNEKENPLLSILSCSKSSQLVEIEKKLLEIKRNLDNSSNNLLKKALIDYFRIINPLSSLWKENEIFSFSTIIILYYSENNIVECLEKAIDIIKEPLLKYLIEIDEFYPKEIVKEKAKCYSLKLILLTQNIEIICDYIKQLFDCDNEYNDIKKEIQNLNLKNHYSIFYLRELIKALINRKDKKENILNIVNDNIKKIQIFRCNKCFDILYVSHFVKGTSLICNNGSHSIINSTILKTLNNYELKCTHCNNILKIYNDNYKCISCKNIVCKDCIEKHMSVCILSNFISLCEVGFTCEAHNKKYIDSCEMCNKNLCEKCKSYHIHIIKPGNHIKFNKNDLESINSNKLGKVKNYIKYYLYQRYIYMKKLKLINVKVEKSLYFMLKKESIIYEVKNFTSNFFFDEDFKDYYKNIIEEAKNGRIEAFKGLEIIKNNYEKIKQTSPDNDNEYRKFLDLCVINQLERVDEFNDYYSLLLNRLLRIQHNFDEIKIIELNKELKEISMDTILLKTKIIGIINSNQIGKDYIKTIFSRCLADYIIRIIFKKYPNKFNAINLSLNNVYEIITNYGNEIIDKTKINLINELARKLIFNKDNMNKEEYEKTIIDYIKSIKTENKIAFKDSIYINNEIIEKNDLNFTLASLLYLKKVGNKSAHPNTEKNSPLKINDVSGKINKKRYLINLDSRISYNSLIDEKLIEDVKISLRTISDEILKDFQETLFNSGSELNNILCFLFKDNWQNIINKNEAFVRALNIDIDKIIYNLKDIDDDFIMNNKKLKEFHENIKEVDEISERIKRNINKFKNYKIDQYAGLEHKIKKQLEKIKNIDFDSLQTITDENIIALKNNLSRAEKKIYIISIIAKEYLNSERFKAKKENAISQFKELVKLEIIKTTLQNIFDSIDKYFKDINDKNKFDEQSFINEVKKFINNNKFGDHKILSDLTFNTNKIIDIISKLIGKRNFEWLSLFEKENTSLISYLYYLQNIKK